MSSQLNGKKIAFLVAQEGVEEVELTEPWKAVENAGGTPELIAPDDGEVQAMNHLDKGSSFKVDRTLADAEPEDYDGVVLPRRCRQPRSASDRGVCDQLPAKAVR
jgi:protease I